MSSAHSTKTEASNSEAKNYVIGFILAVILTAIPFGVVMGQYFDTTTTVAIIMVFGAVQMVVHLVYFLHMDSKSEGGWTLLALLFTVLILAIVLIGSLWIMQHLALNMMEVSPDAARSLP